MNHFNIQIGRKYLRVEEVKKLNSFKELIKFLVRKTSINLIIEELNLYFVWR